MSYAAKRLIILLMAWGLIVFAGVTIRINMNAPAALGVTAAPTPTASPAPVASRAGVLEQTLERNPNDLASLLELGAIYYQQSDWDRATLMYQRAATLDATNVDVLAHLAAAQLYGLRFAQARDTLTSAVALAPRRADLHLLLGLALSRLTPPDTAGARAEWQRVIALAPGTDLATQAQALLNGGANP